MERVGFDARVCCKVCIRVLCLFFEMCGRVLERDDFLSAKSHVNKSTVHTGVFVPIACMEWDSPPLTHNFV